MSRQTYDYFAVVLAFALVPAPHVLRGGAVTSGSAIMVGVFFAHALQVGLTWGRGASTAVEMGIVNSARPTSVSPMATLTSSPADSLATSSVLAATGAFEFFILCGLGFGARSGVLESGVAAGAMEGVIRSSSKSTRLKLTQQVLPQELAVVDMWAQVLCRTMSYVRIHRPGESHEIQHQAAHPPLQP